MADLKTGACTAVGMAVGGAVTAGGVTAPLAITAGMAAAMGCGRLLQDVGVKTDGKSIPKGTEQDATQQRGEQPDQNIGKGR